jgi:DNA-binding transcriptional LysR family regulator
VAFSGYRWQSSHGAHIGKHHHQQPGNHARRRRGRHLPGVDWPFLVADLLASGALVPVLPQYTALSVEISAVYPHRRHLSAKVRAFIDMLVSQYAEEQRRLDRQLFRP